MNSLNTYYLDSLIQEPTIDESKIVEAYKKRPEYRDMTLNELISIKEEMELSRVYILGYPWLEYIKTTIEKELHIINIIIYDKQKKKN